jgi:tRNA(His) guanylyltransferase
VSLGDRIKRYEAASNFTLTPRSCLFIRVDGQAFHTYTRGCQKPFDLDIILAMQYATEKTSARMQGFKLAYIQSDEATFMLTDFDTFETQGWFGYKLSKVVSITASTFTAHFNDFMSRCPLGKNLATFDARAFIVPLDDAPNVFIWRQQDWHRNSVQMLTRAHFSHKECDGKNIPAMHEMLYEKGINWANCAGWEKNGTYMLPGGRMRWERLNYDDLSAILTPDEAELPSA